MTGETAWRLTGIPAVGGRRDYAVVAIVLTAAGPRLMLVGHVVALYYYST